MTRQSRVGGKSGRRILFAREGRRNAEVLYACFIGLLKESIGQDSENTRRVAGEAGTSGSILQAVYEASGGLPGAGIERDIAGEAVQARQGN